METYDEIDAEILVVDATPGIAEALQAFFLYEGYDCDFSVDVFEALRKLAGMRYGLIITTAMLPPMNGFEFVKTIQARAIATPIVLLADETELDEIGLCHIKSGDIEIFEIVIKPFQMEQLLDAVGRGLALLNTGQGLTIDQKRRFRRMMRICEENNVEGIIAPPGQGLSVEEMAVEMWKGGYLPFPTPESMLTEFEKTMHDGPEGIWGQKASFVHAWEFYFVVSHPDGRPVHPDRVCELKRVIAAWVEEQGLEIEDEISVDSAPLVEAEDDGDDE